MVGPRQSMGGSQEGTQIRLANTATSNKWIGHRDLLQSTTSEVGSNNEFGWANFLGRQKKIGVEFLEARAPEKRSLVVHEYEVSTKYQVLCAQQRFYFSL